MRTKNTISSATRYPKPKPQLRINSQLMTQHNHSFFLAPQTRNLISKDVNIFGGLPYLSPKSVLSPKSPPIRKMKRLSITGLKIKGKKVPHAEDLRTKYER